MAGKSQKSVAPIRLHFGDQTRVVVTPDDEDRFMTTSAEAAQACRSAQDTLKWKAQFDALLGCVHLWCKGHAAVARAYLGFSNDGLKVFILTIGSEYRFDFDDAISELDMELAQKFPRCPTEVLHFPEAPVESLTSFFDAGSALQLYGN